MILHRFCSQREFDAFMRGETLRNDTDHGAVRGMMPPPPSGSASSLTPRRTQCTASRASLTSTSASPSRRRTPTCSSVVVVTQIGCAPASVRVNATSRSSALAHTTIATSGCYRTRASSAHTRQTPLCSANYSPDCLFEIDNTLAHQRRGCFTRSRFFVNLRSQNHSFTPMNKILPLLIALVMFTAQSCSQSSNTQTSEQTTEAVTNPYEKGIAYETDDDAPDALRYAMNVIRSEYNEMTRFAGEPQQIEETEVPDRFKINGQFILLNRGSEVLCYYSIYVQKFPESWEYGTLLIGPAPEPTLSSAQFTAKGKMKSMEQSEMTRQTSGKAENVDYTIIKKNAPNYVFVYTPKRLSRDEVMTVYNQLKDQYESVKFTKVNNPDADDYLCIQYGMVFEYDIDKITKIADY